MGVPQTSTAGFNVNHQTLAQGPILLWRPQKAAPLRPF